MEKECNGFKKITKLKDNFTYNISKEEALINIMYSEKTADYIEFEIIKLSQELRQFGKACSDEIIYCKEEELTTIEFDSYEEVRTSRHNIVFATNLKQYDCFRIGTNEDGIVFYKIRSEPERYDNKIRVKCFKVETKRKEKK